MSDAPDSAPQSSDPSRTVPASADGHLPTVRSEELLQGRREILIAHSDEVYRLRLTRNGKLILTK